MAEETGKLIEEAYKKVFEENISTEGQAVEKMGENIGGVDDSGTRGDAIVKYTVHELREKNDMNDENTEAGGKIEPGSGERKIGPAQAGDGTPNSIKMKPRWADQGWENEDDDSVEEIIKPQVNPSRKPARESPSISS